FLNQLIGGKRSAELLPIEHVLSRSVPAEFRGAERAPGDAVARGIEAAERSFKTLYVRQLVVRRNEYVVKNDFAGDRSAQAELAFDLRRRQPLHFLLENEAADRSGIVLRPHDEHVGDRRIRNPGFRPG